MRNTLPALSIPLSTSSLPTQPSPATLEAHRPIPTVRLTNAASSAVGPPFDAGTSAVYNPFGRPSASSPLAPRPLTTSDASRKRLVPKKSKLGLLGAVKGNKERTQNDFSDVVRRIGGTTSAGRDGYEIYVDHAEDPDFEEIVLVKKKKSRLGLDAVAWGPARKTRVTFSNPNPLPTHSSPSHPRTSSRPSPGIRRTQSGSNPLRIFSNQRLTRTRNGGALVEDARTPRIKRNPVAASVSIFLSFRV
jgi:hypothetical protein